MRAQEFVNEVTIDNRTGAGSVPWNQEVDYRGLRVTMKPSTFLRLALPLTDQDNSRMERHIGTGGTIGAPFLDIVVPEAWQSGDFSEPAQVRGHDGRHRMQAIAKLEGDAPVETHLFPKYLRNRDLTPEIVQRLQAGMVTQSGRYLPGPLFDADFELVSRSGAELAEGVEKFNHEVLRPGFRWSEEINNVTYLVRTQWDNMPEVIAKVNNREVGRVTFIKHDTRTALESVSTYVSPRWQGHGIAKNMYAVMRMLGANIWPSGAQTAMGKNMWAKWKKHSDVKHLTSMNAKIDQLNVAEGSLTEYRDQLWTWVQSKFPRTQWPEYVQRDFLYQQAKGIRNQSELDDFLKRNRNDFGKVQWRLEKLPITMDIFTPKTQRMILSREGGSSNPFQVPRDAERHAQQSQMIQQKGVSEEPIIVAKLSNGYDLIEGWHRTIQHLKEFPQGYTAPAWVGYGATYTSESVEQSVAEGMEHYDGIEISMEKEDDEIMVKAMMTGGRKLGHVLFVIDGEYLMPQDLEVDERYQGQGIAATMYDYVKSKGYKIRRSGQQTDAGSRFWYKHKPGKNVWEQGVAENFADGKGPGRPGDSQRHGIPKHATMAELEKASHAKGRKGQLARWQLNMRRGHKK